MGRTLPNQSLAMKALRLGSLKDTKALSFFVEKAAFTWGIATKTRRH